MSKKTNLVRLLAIVAALLLFASACGDDTGTDAGADPEPSSSETPSDDGEGDSETPPEDDEDMATDEPDVDVPTGTFDCAEIQDALESASELAGVSGTSNDPQESFEQSRAALVALGNQAPEISGDVDVAVAALDSFAAVMEKYGWGTDFSVDPTRALAFSQEMLAEGNFIALTTSMSAISAWITTSCTSG